MINPRLFDHYGIDTRKDLKIRTVCSRPFDTVLIDKQGSCYACECTSWLPQSIGNLQIKSLEQIIGGTMHQHLQASITDGSYRYCNEHQCSYLSGGDMLDDKPKHLRYIRLAIDDSCNLRCPSCRKGMIFHKEGSAFNLGIRLADRINDWLHHYEHPIQVHIGSDGDPFASHVYRHFMEQTPVRDNIRYSILTNGLMLNDFHKKIPHIARNLDTLGISIDGATSSTYEKLRLGGKWDKMVDALECAKALKSVHGFEFQLHMVVQQDNWHEMELMEELGHRYQADRVYFNTMEDWNTGINMSAQTFRDEVEFKMMVDRLVESPIAWVNLSTSVSKQTG
jgi:sulfatase maturation enzyme AslB (radical SAM superfamily)